MTYASLADLVDRFGRRELVELTDRTGSGEIDATIVSRALADADAEIDAHLSTRYTVPLDPVPPIVRIAACDIARYRLWEDRASPEVVQRYRDAVALLQRIATGAASIPSVSGPSPPATGRPMWIAPQRRWTMDVRGP